MTERIIAQCFLKGKSYISVVFDDVTLDLIHFKVKGDTKAKLNIYIKEPLVDEELKEKPRSNLGNSDVLITPMKKWKMILDKSIIKLPASLKFRAEWVV